MNASQKAPVPNYPQVWGSRHALVAEVAGAKSYPTGGMSILTSDFGMSEFDHVSFASLSYSGTYYCRVQPTPTSVAPSKQKPALASFKLLWYVLATNAEVANAVDLSGEIVRGEIIGL